MDLLQRISTNDVSILQVGEHVLTILTNEKGRIVDLLIVYKMSSTSLVISGSSRQPEKLANWIEKFIVMENARLDSVSGDRKQYLLFNFQNYGIIADVAIPNSIALRLGYSSVKQVLFVVKKFCSHDLELALSKRGIKQGTIEQYEEYRIENGIPEYPNELSLQFNPLEIGMESLVSFTKGCYVGQEVIARLDTYQKTQKRLRRILLSQIPDRLPAVLFTQTGQEAGILTSCFRHSHQPERILGLGLVVPDHDGSELTYLPQEHGIPGLAKVIPN